MKQLSIQKVFLFLIVISEMMKRNYNSGKRTNNFTHFLSIPLNSAAAKTQIVSYQENILQSLNKEERAGLRGSNSKQFHLTLGMLNLNTEEKIKTTWKIINESQQIINETLYKQKIELGGLKTFDASYEKNKLPRVFFIDVLNTTFLEFLSDFIIRQLIEYKIIDYSDKSTYSQLVLNPKTNLYSVSQFHLTIFRVNEERIKKGGVVPDFFKLLKTFESEKLGSLEIESFDVSTRFQYDEEGFYSPLIRIYV